MRGEPSIHEASTGRVVLTIPCPLVQVEDQFMILQFQGWVRVKAGQALSQYDVRQVLLPLPCLGLGPRQFLGSDPPQLCSPA